MAQIKDLDTTHYYYSPPRKLIRSIGSSSDNGSNNFSSEAADIPDGFASNESPKLKFLFSVKFKPRKSILDLGEDLGSDAMDNNMIFALRRATRPNISATYQNINMYNYRTQVLTKIEYGTTPATLTFYDDTKNRALKVVTQYLKAVSPIARLSTNKANSLEASAESSSVGSIANGYGPFEYITVAHHSIDPDGGEGLSTFYDYINPKIISINLDELDMSTSDVTSVEFSFVYDYVNIWTTGMVTTG